VLRAGRILLAVCLPVAAVLSGCGGADDRVIGSTAEVERAQIERIVVATGTIEPEKEVGVRSRIAGIVETIHVDDGDRVEIDQPVLEIERELLEAQVKEARATLEDARIELRFAKIAVDRSEELERGGASSQQRHDDARTRFQKGRAGVTRAEARLENLSTQLSYATVRSPLAGRVLQVHVEEGDAISPVTAVNGGVVLASLAGTDRLFLEGLVDENEVARVSIGQPARIRTEAYPGRTFRGEVEDIAPLGKRIQNVTYFEVDIEILDEDAHLLRPRMSGDAEIVAEVIEDSLVVPETALRYRGTEIYVEVVTSANEPSVEEKVVELGIVDGDRVQILSGLDEGESVHLK